MKKRPDKTTNESSRALFADSSDWDSVFEKILGLGHQPGKKSYYPELQRKLAELNRFKSLLDQTQDVILMLEKDGGKISDVNEYTSLLLGYSKDELIGMVIDEIVQINYSVNERSITTMIKRDKSEVSVEINIQTVDFDNNAYVVVVGRDITERLRHELEMQQYRTHLEVTVERMRKLTEAVAHAMAAAVEARDPYTAGHQRRVAELSCAIAHEMRLPQSRTECIKLAAIIHDIGKLTIPSEILSKPGRLKPHEFDLIKEHSQVGYDILKGIEFPYPVAQIILQHHERLNGSGYPDGLRGDEIHIEARII